jgi:MFS family permease
VSSIGVANSHTVAQIIGTRILQGIGSSAVLAVGAGTVGDLYRPTERANAMSWFYSGIVLGPALSPVLAGVFTEYTPITWRATQYFLCGASALSVALTAAFLPETSHPPLPHKRLKAELNKKFVPYWFNPIRSVLLMRYANIACATLISCLIMIELYCIMIPLSTIFKERYNLSNVALAGCIYLAHGVGTLIGARIAGRVGDGIVRKWIEKRGYRKPEDRLRAALVTTAAILPLSCFAYGWLLHFNKGGIAPPIVFLVINGIGTPLLFTICNTYLVDALQKRSAEAIAVNNFFRYLFAAAASAFVLPMINAIGLGWTMTIGSISCWLAFGLIVATIRWGEGWRESAAVRLKEVQVAEDGGKPLPQVEEKAEVAEVDVPEATAERREPTTEKGPSRRQSAGSDEHHDERHEEPGHLPTAIKRSRTRGNTVGGGGGLARASSRQSTKSLPTVGEVLQRTVSISGASVHGG